MLPLIEMLTSMQKQAMPEEIARRFDLPQQQAQSVLEALMPAFSQGLKRNASDPAGFAGFMQALAGGQHSAYFDDPSRAFTPGGMQEGNAILAHLFGSKDVSRAIARQAESATGISQNLIKQMLPALAPVILGGLFKQMTGQAGTPQQSRASAGSNPFGRIIEEMLKGGFAGPGRAGGNTPGRAPQGRNPLEEILEQMTGGGMGRGQGGGAPSGSGSGTGGALGDIFTDMLRQAPSGGGGSGRPREFDESKWREPSARQEAPRDEPSHPRGGGLDDLFGDMFESGREVNRQYQDSIESIFEEFLGPRRR